MRSSPPNNPWTPLPFPAPSPISSIPVPLPPRPTISHMPAQDPENTQQDPETTQPSARGPRSKQASPSQRTRRKERMSSHSASISTERAATVLAEPPRRSPQQRPGPEHVPQRRGSMAWHLRVFPTVTPPASVRQRRKRSPRPPPASELAYHLRVQPPPPPAPTSSHPFPPSRHPPY